MARAKKSTLSSTLNAAIDASGMTKGEVAERMGTSPSQLYRILAADPDSTTNNTTINALQRLATALGRQIEIRIV